MQFALDFSKNAENRCSIISTELRIVPECLTEKSQNMHRAFNGFCRNGNNCISMSPMNRLAGTGIFRVHRAFPRTDAMHVIV